MTLEWTDWEEDPFADPGGAGFRTPYVDWYVGVEVAGGGVHPFSVLRRSSTSQQRFPFALADLPLPKKAFAKGATEIPEPEPRVDAKAGIAVVPREDDVIVGVIDAGIALSHERFRRAGGTGTRILSHWAQAGGWTDQKHLPFGHELMQEDIDGLMKAASTGGSVDEEAFNRAAGLVDFSDPFGERWIETPAPHGTQVADLVAGVDPAAEDAELQRLRDRTHFIMVDLAPRVSIGPSGSFLGLYATWAIRHIVETADAIWTAHYGKTSGKPGLKGFPIVINMSYGLSAGPKDGTLDLQKFVRVMNEVRKDWMPVRLLVPAGNDNLERCSAVLARRGKDETRSIGWRILPEDVTSSYVEIWTDPKELAKGKAPLAVPVSVTPPFGQTSPPEAGRPGTRRDLVDRATGRTIARIYCRQSDNLAGMHGTADVPLGATGYVICVAPTGRAGAAAPAGSWRITVGEGPLAKVYVQLDQNLAPSNRMPMLSYLEETEETAEDDHYQRFNPDGGLRDTYGFDRRTGEVVDTDSKGPVRRQTTLNAIGASFGMLTIGGYRAIDGLPADYSSSGRGHDVGTRSKDERKAAGKKTLGGWGIPDAASVSDDGLWHAGRLAAGAKSGSVVAVQGTSFATADASRMVISAILDCLDAKDTTRLAASERWLHARAIVADKQAVEAAGGNGVMPPAGKMRWKLGFGRLPRQPHGRKERIPL